MNKSSLSVSGHPTAKQFVRYVGQAVGRDGTPKPRCFYLGADEADALPVAARLRSDWAALKASGTTAWPAAYLAAFQRGRTNQDATVGPLITGQTVADAVAAETVADARTAYLAEQRQRFEAGQVSASFYRGMSGRMSVMLDRLPKEPAIADRPLRSIGEAELRRVILH